MGFRVVAVREQDGRQQALVQWADGHWEWRDVRVSVSRTIHDADGRLVAAGEVASTDDGSVTCA